MRHLLRNSIGVLVAALAFPALALASSGTIDASYKYAWDNQGGWVNFAPTNGGLTVTDSAITGYAWAQNTGWINFDTAQSGVTNDGHGTLGGFAWSEGEGWLSFTGVTIDTNGKFHGSATSATSTLTFDCTNCDVRTTWRAASGGSSGGGIIWPNTNQTQSPTTTPSPASPTYAPQTTNPSYSPGNGTSTEQTEHFTYGQSGAATTTSPATHTGTTTSKHSAFPQLPIPPWAIPAGLLLLILLFFALRFFRVF